MVSAVPPSTKPAEGSPLAVSGVSKSFRGADGSLVLALNGLSLTIRAGEMAALVGPSGCGKSTLLRLIAGLDSPTSGELRVGAEPITGPSAERGLVFQDPSLFPWLTVRRNIQAGLVARGVLYRRRPEVEEFMQLVGLEAFANVYPHQLSGGMAQRAALARALINHPKVLLLDEPLDRADDAASGPGRACDGGTSRAAPATKQPWIPKVAGGDSGNAPLRRSRGQWQHPSVKERKQFFAIVQSPQNGRAAISVGITLRVMEPITRSVMPTLHYPRRTCRIAVHRKQGCLLRPCLRCGRQEE